MEIDRQKIPFESSLQAFLTSTFSVVLNSVSVRDLCCLFLILIFIIFINLLSCHHPPWWQDKRLLYELYEANVFASYNSTVQQPELTYLFVRTKLSAPPSIRFIGASCGTVSLFGQSADGGEASVGEAIKSAVGPEKWAALVTAHQEFSPGPGPSVPSHSATVFSSLWTGTKRKMD